MNAASALPRCCPLATALLSSKSWRRSSLDGEDSFKLKSLFDKIDTDLSGTIDPCAQLAFNPWHLIFSLLRT